MGQSEKMEQEDNRPKWLLELENRKRKPRLAHEVGAGAPCMTCSTACPGLDLHFWRKICKNCKCSRDDHDVPNDEFPQFDLLFGPSGKPNKKMIVLKVNKKQDEDEVTFEWAPPDTTKELAADYMKALPEDKLPIKGSAGAALRKQQLQRQLPLHDIDHKVCDELSDSERKQFEKYLENLKKYVGQGKVTKAMGARPFDLSLMTPANAADMNRFSPKHKQNQSETSHRLNLRTPSSFVQKTGYPSSLASSELTNSLGNRSTSSPLRDQSPSASARFESVRSPAFGHSITENSPQGRYHRALVKVRNDGEITRSVPVGGTRNPPLNFARTSTIDDSIGNSLANENQTKIDESVNSCTKNIYNPAVEFAASNMMSVDNRGVNSSLENSEKTDKKQELNYATSSTLGDQETALSSAKNSTINPETSAALSNSIIDNTSSLRNSEMQNDEEAIARNREWAENSLLAEKMLNEALLPPSAIHAHDIIGSTLGEEGLSLIREKLTSKYSAKEEPVNLQGASRCRGLLIGEKKENGAKAKRSDQLRRQGAFDKELDRNDVTQGVPIGNEEHPSNHIADNSSLETEHLHAGFDNSEGNGISRENKKISDDTGFKDTSSNDPRRAIMRGIWENYAARPEQLTNDLRTQQNEHNFPMNATAGSNFDKNSQVLPTASCQSVQAELSNYGHGNSYLIQSEELNNQIFPEQARFSSGVVQNPASIDRLRGAMEEMSVNHPKMQNCHECRESIRTGDVVVTAEKAQDAFWHPGCFVCSVCNELLADLVYFYYKGKLYCGRDLPTLLEIPRCFACDELIFVREYTVAEGHNYHVKHFCCWDCDVPLAGQQYISENDRPLCLPCYQKTYAKTCSTCRGVIAADQQGVAVKNLNFHANDQCFCCATCKKSLLNGKMAIKEDRPFCSKECITVFLNERTS